MKSMRERRVWSRNDLILRPWIVRFLFRLPFGIVSRDNVLVWIAANVRPSSY
jgi:hypothetical protein